MVKYDDLPFEIKEKMLKYQKEHTGKTDPKVFRNIIWNRSSGFDWAKTSEGHNFWRLILVEKNIDIFYKKYPKNSIWF